MEPRLGERFRMRFGERKDLEDSTVGLEALIRLH